MIDKQIQKLLVSQKTQEILKSQLQDDNEKIGFNVPKIVDSTKSHLHRDENYSNNISDLNILKRQHQDHLKTLEDPDSINNTKTKISNIDKKLSMISTDKENTDFKRTVTDQLSKEQENEFKLHNKIAKATLNVDKADTNNMGFSLRSPEAIRIHAMLKDNADNGIDDTGKLQIQRELSAFTIRSNEIENEIKDLERIPGIKNKIKITSLNNELNMRNKFIEKLKEH